MWPIIRKTGSFFTAVDVCLQHTGAFHYEFYTFSTFYFDILLFLGLSAPQQHYQLTQELYHLGKHNVHDCYLG